MIGLRLSMQNDNDDKKRGKPYLLTGEQSPYHITNFSLYRNTVTKNTINLTYCRNLVNRLNSRVGLFTGLVALDAGLVLGLNLVPRGLVAFDDLRLHGPKRFATERIIINFCR